MNTPRWKIWVQACRLRTLPLASAAVLLGSGLAASEGYFQTGVFVLCLLTAIGLQILSNLANDYGDAVSGADNEDRVGPDRAVSAGLITQPQMRRAMTLVAVLTVILGLALLFTAFPNDFISIIVFVVLGGLALYAAVNYTVGLGRKPYGYQGLGDLSVFIFFGLIGVLGTYYLFTHHFEPLFLLPATSSGLLATAVLNINNIRDMENDVKTGKHTFASKIGQIWARRYHWVLVGGAGMTALIFIVAFARTSWPWIFLPGWMLVILSAWVVETSEDPLRLDAQLKRTALSSFLFNLLLAIGFALD